MIGLGPSLVAFGEAERDVGEGRALDGDAEDFSGEVGGGLQPFGAGFKLAGVSAFFSGRRIGHREQLQGLGPVGDRCFNAQMRRRDSDEGFHVPVEDVAGEQSGLRRADQLQMEGLFAQDDRRAAMWGPMFVFVGSSMIVTGWLFFASASGEDGRQADSQEGDGKSGDWLGIHGVRGVQSFVVRWR